MINSSSFHLISSHLQCIQPELTITFFFIHFFSSTIHKFIYCSSFDQFFLSSLGFLHSRYHDGQTGSHAINYHVCVCAGTRLLVLRLHFLFNLSEQNRFVSFNIVHTGQHLKQQMTLEPFSMSCRR